MTVRGIVSAIGVAFTAYLAARGLLWGTNEVDHPWLIYLALALYVVVTWTMIFWGARAGGSSPSGALEKPA